MCLLRSLLDTTPSRLLGICWTLLELPKGVVVQISDETDNHGLAVGYCTQLANHLGVRASTSGEGMPGYESEKGYPMMRESFVNWRTQPFYGRTSLLWTLFSMLLVMLNFLLFFR